MRLQIDILGVTVFFITTEKAQESPPGEGDGVEVTRHAGDFQIGFRTQRHDYYEAEAQDAQARSSSVPRSG